MGVGKSVVEVKGAVQWPRVQADTMISWAHEIIAPIQIHNAGAEVAF